MKSAVVHTFGESPRFEEFPDPVLAEGEVLVRVRAAGLHPVVNALARGLHYGSTDMLPMIPGVDGVGQLDDGTRVYFGMLRDPYGTMAELAAVPRTMCVPLPDSIDDITAAALFNPGLAAWLALTKSAYLAPGETVLISGATGSSGKLAIQIAKRLGAGKVIALGRNKEALSQLPALGADVTISLNQPEQDLIKAIAGAAGSTGIHVIIDYLWGRPTELVIAAVTRKGLTQVVPKVRLIEVGSMAGSTITLPASVLRSSGLEIYGSGAGTVSVEAMIEALPGFIEQAAGGQLHIDTEAVPLNEVEAAWSRPTRDNSRLVFIP